MAADNAKFKKLLELTQGDYKAFLYDCDGTLADTMPAHVETYIRLTGDAGVTLDPAIIDEFAGLPVPAVVAEINKRYNSTFDPEGFAETRAQLFYDEYIDKVKPIEYVTDHLIAHAGKLRIGVVSGGDRAAVTKTLQVLGILDLVEVLVCAGETPRGKPFPDPFLAAAEKLGVKPAECLVFEDGNAGVASAKAAGMPWIRIDKV
ncbi:HAD family hydrolase [Mucilaginibacter myungsuensis]|uniref:HAD family phosphatase n=1 Tax=Mucilaginibacter myungsuensis TaxID=649104 RepID=A0A929KUE2_9SPHI|nr:HAD family phosphatase [Mucilaginibacter myungsuensis]MBE9661362.1 HAD family phosphatase [Mucilaginibacter myungsuensis]MDN3597505.1 HAD family phosphatase [Mucilaginibacter myungsuensis]